MEAYYKKGNDHSPQIQFDPESSVFSIKGNSIPMDAQTFFADVVNWLERYSEHPNEHTKLEIDLKYLNGRSIQTILRLLNQMKRIDQAGKGVLVEWSVPREAEDLQELSKDILDNLSIPHHILSN